MALSAIQDPNGPILYTSGEEQLIAQNKIPDRPWATVIHTVPHQPAQMCIDSFLASPQWQSHKTTCVGLFTLSSYTASYVGGKVDCPVSMFRHPMLPTLVRWSPQRYDANRDKKLVVVGSFLRDFDCAAKLYQSQQTPQRIVVLRGTTSKSHTGLPTIDRLEDAAYDQLLTENVVFVPLKDVSACNGILDCMATNTPVLTNRLPASEEYLGKKYPLFYDELDEAARLVSNPEMILAAHEYLRDMDKRHVSVAGMLFQLQESTVWKRVVEKAEGGVSSWVTTTR